MDVAEIARMIAALAVTLGLVGLAAWAMRRYGPATLLRMQTPAAERRLSIVETLMLDPQRRLVLIRFDQQERLILLGEGRVLAEHTVAPSPFGGGVVKRLMQRIFGRITPADCAQAAQMAVLTTLLAMVFPAIAAAQAVNINLGTGAGLTERVVQLVGLLTVLSLAPSIVIMTTSFVRIIVVLSLLRTALGLQQSPPNAVLVSLSLFLTALVMAPTFQASYDAGIKPLLDQQMELPAAFDASVGPVKVFMAKQVDREDLALFVRLAKVPPPKTLAETPIQVLTPAFMISELKRAFEIGFLLFVPFLVIDLVVASVLMSMGMMMLPPVVVSLPFKLIFFVLVDGWRLVAGSLVESFQRGAGGG